MIITEHFKLIRETQKGVLDMMCSILDRQECGQFVRSELYRILSDALDKVDELRKIISPSSNNESPKENSTQVR